MDYKGGTFQYGGENYYPNAYYKVGDLFLTTNSENPSVRFGGTWELFGKGKALVCIDEDDEDFNTIGKTVGEKTHTLTTDEIPSHSHKEICVGTDWYQKGTSGDWCISSALEPYRNTGATGGGEAHNNLQPSIVCYIWRRVK